MGVDASSGGCARCLTWRVDDAWHCCLMVMISALKSAWLIVLRLARLFRWAYQTMHGVAESVFAECGGHRNSIREAISALKLCSWNFKMKV